MQKEIFTFIVKVVMCILQVFTWSLTVRFFASLGLGKSKLRQLTL